MATVSIQLFGKLCVWRNEQVIDCLEGCKVQELFGYLLLYRHRPHPRETLAGLLWGDNPRAQSKKYLRQSLWQLQTALGTQAQAANKPLLLVDPDWIQFNQQGEFWLDLEVFEQIYAEIKGMPGRQLNAQRAGAVHDAVRLYKGDLLEGCYQDWCLYERERLQAMYLAMLDKLVGYSEAHGDYEAGLEYGMRVLRQDRARERTHRQMMRLHYLAGDRTGALHQYERCTAALREELSVKPAQSTIALYEQIRADQLATPQLRPVELIQNSLEPQPTQEQTTVQLPDVLDRLTRLQGILADMQSQVRKDIQAIKMLLNERC